jgi:hypothetical protein
MFDKSMVLADDCSSNSSSSSVQVQPNVTEVTERITRRKRKRKFSRNTGWVLTDIQYLYFSLDITHL